MFASAARGEDSSGISVFGSGEVRVKPTRVEINLTAGAGAELTGDALVKYQDSLRRTLAAFEKLELRNLKIEQRGLSFASDAGSAGAQGAYSDAGPSRKSKIAITRSLRLALIGVDKLSEAELTTTIGQLLDAAKDAGATIGAEADNAMLMRMMGQTGSPTPVVTFVVEDVQQAREAAYQQAFDQAKSRASRLARLADAELGAVEAIEEAPEATGDKNESIQARMITAIYGISSKSGEEETRLTADQLVEIPVRVTLKVRFSLNSKAPKS
ncbi:MAG TPA: SIMPL domain-containing protein [Pirellulales bacterium]|nr:SIMPL domain-containing protein [Pirellulales bacterium]